MNHRIKGRKLSRNSAHRKALLRNLAISLIVNGRIKTTLPKAKELRPYVEKIVTISKVDNLSNRRLAYSILGNNHDAINRLFGVVGPKVLKRNGGYTRILKFGFRTGDKAPMALIEFVDDLRVKTIISSNSSNNITTEKKSPAKSEESSNDANNESNDSKEKNVISNK